MRSRGGRPPVVHTLHGPWTEPSRKLYGLLADYVHLVAISAAQRADNPDIRYAGVVHNGVDLDEYPLVEDKDDFLVYIGRANPDKGPTLAIEVARRAGLPLAMVVKKNEPFERAYWDEIVAPLLHDEVEVYEAISHERKVDLLGRARAMVFPIQWPEPFGLVMVEAMACGTPVVACPAGAAVELVDEGVTGYLRESIDGLVQAVGEVGRCSPIVCRAAGERELQRRRDGRGLRTHVRGSDLRVITAVTGATGHVGASLVRALLDDGRTVRAVNRQPGAALAGLDVEFVAADVGDPTRCGARFQGVEVVYHLAALISIAGDPDGRVRATNVDGVRNVRDRRARCRCASLRPLQLGPRLRPRATRA